MNARLETLIAVPTLDPATTAGSILYWDGEGTAQRNELLDAWVAQGLDPDLLLALPSPTIALTRSCDDAIRGNKARTKKNAGHEQWLIYDVHPNRTDKFTDLCTVSLVLDGNGDKVLTIVPAPGAPMAAVQQISDTLRERFPIHQQRLEVRDMNNWLNKDLLPGQGMCNAVALKYRSGFWYVMPAYMEIAEKIMAALNQATAYVFNSIPAMQSEGAVASILRGITMAAESQADAIDKIIEEEAAGVTDRKPRGKRAWETCATDCDAMIAKVEEYETLLGASLDTMRERLTDLAAASTEAAMEAESKAEEERAEKKAKKGGNGFR